MPIVSLILKPGDQILIANTDSTVISIDPFSITYKGDFIPGSPITKDNKVVGMHIAKNTGVNM